VTPPSALAIAGTIDQYADGAMKLVRRILAALLMTGAAAAAIRVKGRGGTPPQHGGWRPLELPDERAA
jgi:hypothetical protein